MAAPTYSLGKSLSKVDMASVVLGIPHHQAAPTIRLQARRPKPIFPA